MLRQLLLLAIVVGSGLARSEIANSQQPIRAREASKPAASKPATTRPTPPEKTAELNRRGPLEVALTGGRYRWTYTAGIEGEPLSAQIVAVADGVVTLRDADDVDHDVVVAELATFERIAVERVAQLIAKTEWPDERALLGSWFTEQVTSAARYIGGDPPKFEKLIIRGVCLRERFGDQPVLWTIDPTASPKRIDFGTGYPDEVQRGIYELDGDTLRICLPRSGPSPRMPIPTTFVDGPSQQLRTYRRLPDVMTLPPLKADELDPDVAAKLREIEALFTAEQIDESAGKFLRPEDAAKFTPAERAKIFASWNRNRRDYLNMTRAMLRVAPTWNADRTAIRFDFSRVHVDTDSTSDSWGMTKIDGRWYPGGPESPRRGDTVIPPH